MCYSTDFLICINIAPRNNGCGACEFSVNFSLIPWILAHFKNSTVKSRIYPRELGWSLHMRHTTVNILRRLQPEKGWNRSARYTPQASCLGRCWSVVNWTAVLGDHWAVSVSCRGETTDHFCQIHYTKSNDILSVIAVNIGVLCLLEI